MLESAYPSMPLANYPPKDAIVVLGGNTGHKTFPRYEAEETDGSRLMPALRLFKKKKAKLIIVSGGGRYDSIDGTERTESSDMKDILLDYGIPDEVIIEENQSRNTIENALYVKKIMEKRGLHNILLVTSAVHMRRAKMIFDKVGIDAVPVPVLHKAIMRKPSIGDFIPEAGAMTGMNSLFKEFMGYWLTYFLPFSTFSK